MHTHFFYFSIFLFFYFFYFSIIYVFGGWAQLSPCGGWAGPSQPGPARSLAQASDPAGPNQTGGTRGVSPRLHALCEGN